MLCHYGKRSLGHEHECENKRDIKRVKRMRATKEVSETQKEEFLKEILQNYISSIRDASF